MRDLQGNKMIRPPKPTDEEKGYGDAMAYMIGEMAEDIEAIKRVQSLVEKIQNNKYYVPIKYQKTLVGPTILSDLVWHYLPCLADSQEELLAGYTDEYLENLANRSLKIDKPTWRGEE